MNGYLIFGFGFFLGVLATLLVVGLGIKFDREHLARDYPQGDR